MRNPTEPSSTLSSVSGIPADHVHHVWTSVRELLLKPMAMSGGRLDEASVLRALLDRDMQLWIAHDREITGAMVTQIAIYPTGKSAIAVLLIAGQMSRWFHHWPEIEAWARAQGCDVAEIPRGRKGWNKRLKDWKAMAFMEKAL